MMKCSFDIQLPNKQLSRSLNLIALKIYLIMLNYSKFMDCLDIKVKIFTFEKGLY